MEQQLARKVAVKVFTMRKNSMFVYCVHMGSMLCTVSIPAHRAPTKPMHHNY